MSHRTSTFDRSTSNTLYAAAHVASEQRSSDSPLSPAGQGPTNLSPLKLNHRATSDSIHPVSKRHRSSVLSNTPFIIDIIPPQPITTGVIRALSEPPPKPTPASTSDIETKNQTVTQTSTSTSASTSPSTSTSTSTREYRDDLDRIFNSDSENDFDLDDDTYQEAAQLEQQVTEQLAEYRQQQRQQYLEQLRTGVKPTLLQK